MVPILLRVLIIEDVPDDRELLLHELRRSGFEPEWRSAETADSFAAALAADEQWDIILSDYTLPGFGAPQALALLKRSGRDIPFIMVSGTIGDELAVSMMHLGACDYILKDNLTRLAPAVNRELKESENRRARLKAEHAVEQLAAVVESSIDPIISEDLDGIITTWNPAAERFYEWDAKEAIGRHVSFIVPPDRMEEFARIKESLRRGERIEWLDTIRLRRDGTRTDVAASFSSVRDRAGRLVGVSTIARDITAMKRAERERDDALKQLRLQIDRMPLGYLLFDAEVRLADWNSAAERIFGYSKEEVRGMGPPFDKILPASAWPNSEAILHRILAGDMTAHAINENLTKDGRTITCEWSNTPLVDANGVFLGIVSLAHDITEQRDLEAQLRQSQKMEAIGQLAGGVAHDFNNLLTVITGYSELLLQSMSPDDSRWALLEEIRKAGERSASLTRQLLAFSRKQVLVSKVVDLNQIVRDTERMLGRIIGEDVSLTTVLQDHLGHVKADPGQLGQVVLNLAVNARDAMPSGGSLTIETRNVEIKDYAVRQHPIAKAGPYVMLAVADSGIGMTEEVKRRLFEPFFTTKDPGKGTGLGLAVVHGFIKQSGGHIEVESKPGAGTCFRVFLPRIEQPVSSDEPLPAPARAAHAFETILLVEDEEGVRSLTRHILQQAGYTVLEAADGDDAVRTAGEYEGTIHLLITDVVMPVVGGRALAERLVAERPEMKVLYLSGYTSDAVLHHGIMEHQVNFLQKPFSPAAFLEKVSGVLAVTAK